jgi:hypothetical protein
VSSAQDRAFQEFMERVWRLDVAPLLRGRYARQRSIAARAGGQVAATGGRLIDRLLRLKGRPFTRAGAVLGSSLGALLPDVWDWQWLRTRSSTRQREQVARGVRAQAANLEDDEALALFGLSARSSRDELHEAWRGICKKWHPDLARTSEERRERHVRFIAYQAAYERLERAYNEGRLPRPSR